jgi:hypothetical protein
VGALLCFKGKDLFRPAIAIFVFWLVYSSVMGGASGSDEKDVLIAVLAGLVVALLSGFVLRFGVFLAGMVMGLSLGKILFDMFPQIQEMAIPRIAFLVVVTILVGILTVKSMDLIILIATAGLGAILIAVPCIYMVFDYHNIARNIAPTPAMTINNINDAMFVRVATDQPLAVLIVVLILMVAGIVVQHKTSRKSHQR